MPKFLNNIDLDQNQLEYAVIHSGSTKPSSGSEVAGQLFFDTDTNQLQIFTDAWEGVQTETIDGSTQFNSSLKIGRDAHNLIDFSTDDAVTFRVGNADEITLAANEFSPTTSDGIALGTASKMWSDLFLASGAVINFNNGDVTATHSSNTLTIAGGTLATAALTTSTIVASGIVKTDDTTNATSTTDGSLQTDGGLSVALDAVFGDDVFLLTDSAAISLGVGKDASISHDGTTGLVVAATPISINSTGDLTLDSTTDIIIDPAGGNVEFKDAGTLQLTLDMDGTAGDIDINLNVDGDDLVFNQYDGTEVLRLQDDTTVVVATDLTVGDDLLLKSDSAVLSLGAGADFTITHDGTTGATIAGNPIIITSGANVDINATTGITVDATTMSIDGDDDSNITVTGSGKDLDIAVAGGSTQELRLTSAGTGASAMHLNASAGGINIDSADMIDIDAADEITITTTSADGHISLVSAHTAGDALHIDCDANAGSIVNIDAGILDIDVTAGVTLDATTMSIDGTDDSNITVTASAKDLDIAVAGGGTQELRLASAGTGASALDLTTSAGGMDINSADMITVDAADEITITTTSADGHISLVSAHTAGQAIHLDGDANAGSIVDIDAGILDIDVTAATTLDTTLLTLTGVGGLKILDTTASAATEGGSLILANDDGAVMADNHRLGVIEFQGAEDTSNTLTTGARIEAICDAEWSASENGASLLFYTTDANAAQGVALTLDSDQKATFAADAHVAGNLTVAGTTTTQNTVLIENTVTTLVFEGATEDAHETTLKVVEPTADCTFSLPTLTAGNFFLPAIADTATDASAAVTAAEFALLDGGSTVGTTAVANGDGIFTNDGGAMKHTTVQTFQTYFDANSVGGANIVTTGTIGTGVWQGTAIASAYLDADTAHLSGSQTFTGTKTLNSFKGTGGATVTNILDEDAMGSDSATALATQQSIKAYVDSNAGSFSQFYLEDDDGTEITVNNNKEIKFIGAGITTNWTDTSTGSDGDPFDMTFTVDAAQTVITSILATDVKIGEDDQTKIDFETANEIHLYADNAEQVYVADGIFGPETDSDVDLGTTGVRWKDAFIDTITTTGDVDVLGNLELGHATDTTVARSAAGIVTIEGLQVAMCTSWVLNNSVSGVASSDNITYNITHGMGAGRNYGVEVIRNGANSGDYGTRYVDVTRSSDTVVTIVFASARTAGDYTALITKFPE